MSEQVNDLIRREINLSIFELSWQAIIFCFLWEDNICNENYELYLTEFFVMNIDISCFLFREMKKIIHLSDLKCIPLHVDRMLDHIHWS